MSKILSSENFGDKIYNRFPIKYREDDVLQDYALKRYIQSLSDGGFKYAIEDINGLMDLIDPDKVSYEVITLLFKQYGLEIFNGIPEQYLRYLLPKMGELWKNKGSISALEFLTSSISGIRTLTDVTYDAEDNPTINVKLEVDNNIGEYIPAIPQLKKLLENFIPFYCDLTLAYYYVFMESSILRCFFEESYDFINDLKEEYGNFRNDQRMMDKTISIVKGTIEEEGNILSEKSFMPFATNVTTCITNTMQTVPSLDYDIISNGGSTTIVCPTQFINFT